MPEWWGVSRNGRIVGKKLLKFDHIQSETLIIIDHSLESNTEKPGNQKLLNSTTNAITVPLF